MDMGESCKDPGTQKAQPGTAIAIPWTLTIPSFLEVSTDQKSKSLAKGAFGLS
jgi:hypothetical protein